MPQAPLEPGRLAILPLASTLNPPHDVRACVDALIRTLCEHGLEPRLLDQAEDAPDARLIAHLDRDSLPAALEILSRARQAGRRGCICLLNASEDGFDAPARQVRYRGVHARLRQMRLARSRWADRLRGYHETFVA